MPQRRMTAEQRAYALAELGGDQDDEGKDEDGPKESATSPGAAGD